MTRRTFLRQSGFLGGAFLVGTPFVLPALSNRTRPMFRVERVYVSMGTTVRYLVFHEDEREALDAVHAAQEVVRKIHDLMSVHETQSELSRWNRSQAGEDVLFDPLTAEAVDEALRYRKITSGRFDPTVGAAVHLTASGHCKEPSGEHPLSWNAKERRLQKGNPLTTMDLGGSAKGWAVDRATDILVARGAFAALVNAGGDLRAVGHPPDEDSWPIGIRNPLDPESLLCELRISNSAVATSGGYESEGSTIIDPRDAQPVSFAGSATVIAPTCGTADCLSTALCVEPDANLFAGRAHALIARRVGAVLATQTSDQFPSHATGSVDPRF